MAISHTIVIGAGISGLTAAYQLHKAGINVQVLERRPNPGGRMFTVDWQGFRVDPGAKFVTTSDRFLLEMVRELGLEDQVVRQGQGLTIVIYRNGKFHQANFLSIPSYLCWSGVSLGARLSMLKLIPHFLSVGRMDSVYHLERARGSEDQSMEAFFYEKINPEMYEYWAQPMFETMCSYTGDDVSSKAFLAMMAGYMNADTVTFKDGIGALPVAMAARLDVHYGADVRSIEIYPDGSGVRVSYSQDGSGHVVDTEQLVVAVPGNHVLSLFPSPRPAWHAFFPQVAYTISAMQYHVCRTGYQPPVPGVFIPRRENLPVNSLGFEQYQDGCWLLLSDPRVGDFSLDMPDDVLIERAVAVFTQLFPALKDTFIAHRIFRWSEKVPTFRPGYLAALAQFWQDPQESPVYFCGDYFAGPSTGGALYSGKDCASRILGVV